MKEAQWKDLSKFKTVGLNFNFVKKHKSLAKCKVQQKTVDEKNIEEMEHETP